MHKTDPDIHDTSSNHEQLGNRTRQTIPQDRSMGEKQSSTMSTGNPGEVAMNPLTSDAPANNEENSVRHRKKNNKSARNNKNKLDEGLPNSSFPSPDTVLVPQKLHPGSRKSNPSVSAAEAISVPFENLNATVVPAEAFSVENSSEIPVMPLKQGLTESTEESHARENNHWKPRPQRKSAKTQQTNKSVSKYNVGAEAVIWAPVKPLNKNGPSVEASKNSVIEATYPSGKSGHDMQSGIKAMRAEMGRYIWKPVAKELSQQVNSQQNSPSQSHPEAGDMSAKHDSNRLTVEFGKPDGVTVGKATIATDARSGENIKHNKHGKISSSWRQRSSETPRVVGSLSSDPAKAVQKASDQLQPSTTDSVLIRDMTHILDGWNDVTNTSPPGGSVASTAVPKNVGANRQRCQPYKEQRVPGSPYPTDNTDTHRVMTDRRETHSPALGLLNESDGGKVMKTESENTAIGEHSKPHWQPKSQAYSHHGRQGNRGTGGGQRVSAQGIDCNVVQNEHKNDISPRTVGAEAGDVRLQDAKRGGKGVGDTSKDDSTVGSAPVDVNPQHQQSVDLEVDHQGHYNNCLKRGHDSRYRGKDMGQDAGKRNFHMNGDEPHLEYQQVGNYHKPQNFEKLFLQVKKVNIDNTVALAWVVSQIFEKALTEPTFCEMYANFCAHLSYELPDFYEDNEKITFRRLLLNKCLEEFERGEREEAEANRAEEDGEIKQTEAEREEKRTQARRRMLGNIRLIGELYKKRMLTERIMHECIKKLLGEYENPDEEDLEALCVLMSTIGEMIDHPKAKVHMDGYFIRMLKLSTDQKLSSGVRFMLRDAIDLRKNKWQQRRKIEGPKKIDEVHRDAAQERQAQASRFSRGPVINSAPRRGPPADYSSRSNSVLPSLSSQQINSNRGMPAQVRGHATQDVRMDERQQFESRVLSVPLPQRSTDDTITLGPQVGLARGMSIRGQPLMSNAPSADVPPNLGDSRRLASGSNSYNFMSREDFMPRYTQDKFSSAQYDQPSPYGRSSSIGSRDPRFPGNVTDKTAVTTIPGRKHASSGFLPAPSETKQLSQECLREKSISAIREFYSAKDEEEVILCIKELKSPSFYPSMVSLWVTDSFERKDKERDLLAKLLVNLCKSRDNLLRQNQLIQGFVSVLSTLEDAVNDAPRAAEFLGHIFAKVTLEQVVPLTEIARLIREGGEEPGSLVETGLASVVLASILQFIRTEKGDSVLSEIRTSSGLRLEDFRPPQVGLARGMSIRGQPLMSNAPSADVPPNLGDSRRLASGSNSYNFMSREDFMPRYTQDKFSSAQYDQPSPYGRSSSIGSRDPRFSDNVTDKSAVTTVPGRKHASSGFLPAPSETKQLSQESLREKSISAIREFYSAKDEEEVILCIKELKSPSFYPSMVSLWVTDSFERKDKERDLLAKLLVNLCKSRDNLLRQNQLIQGFVSVLSTLEDAVNDAPRAAEFLGHIFAKVTLEQVVSLTEIARLIREGGEEPGSLVETGLASEVLASILQFIRTEKGDSVLSEIRTSSGLRLEDFRPPQVGLARGMSIRGQPLMSNAPSADVPPNLGDSRRLASGSNSYNFMSREDFMPRYTQDKFSSAQYDQPSPYGRSSSIGSRDPRFSDNVTDKSAVTTIPGRKHASSAFLPAPSETKQLSQESLREKSISAIREFYSAKDEEEVILCIKELKSPSFYPSMVSLWVTDSFERKDKERDLLAKLLVNLCKSRDNLLRQNQLVQGFVSVLSALEDAVIDAPRAAEFLGHIFAKVTLEHVVPLTEIARLIREGGEEPGSLVETGLASEVLASILQFIRTEKGDSVLSEIRTSSGLRLEDFRPPHSTRSNKLDPFL
ncbi:eukaryotic translation initiation factor 4G [Iris pallida]|uniref:Eukaryotic translation initiation factor 4G n=1 Tax=Iris pallida TaxID=29817 RepID=A0AAX6IGU0_IRIPA|nr:eukaryotic translation initiation factor 4G [Iris pallida]